MPHAEHNYTKSEQQGVGELKKNYKIEKNQTLLGTGRYGKVFLSQNLLNPEF